jgi:hypothetical protein
MRALAELEAVPPPACSCGWSSFGAPSLGSLLAVAMMPGGYLGRVEGCVVE